MFKLKDSNNGFGGNSIPVHGNTHYNTLHPFQWFPHISSCSWAGQVLSVFKHFPRISSQGFVPKQSTIINEIYPGFKPFPPDFYLVGGFSPPLWKIWVSSSIKGWFLTFPIFLGKCQIDGNHSPPTRHSYYCKWFLLFLQYYMLKLSSIIVKRNNHIQAGWWLATLLKNMSSSIGMIINPILMGK